MSRGFEKIFGVLFNIPLEKTACKKRIASIKKNAPIAEIEDTTDEKAAVKKTATKTDGAKGKGN